MSIRVLPVHEATPGRRFLTVLATPGGAVFLLVLALLVAIMVSNPSFADGNALIRFAGRTAPIAIAAMGQYFVIVSGEFDLSMGAVIAAQVVLAGNVIGQDEARILPGLLLMLAVGAGIGLLNGLATTLLKVPSFIVTLGMMLSLTGLVRYVTGGAATGNPSDRFREIGRGGIDDVPLVGTIPYPLLVLVVVAVFAVWLMRRPFGRTLIAAGDNAEAAHFSGTPLWWTKTRAFMISSLSATVAGILLVGYAGVHPSVGSGYEFAAITAVVLGGVVLGGGRGWVLSAAAGAFALELLFLLLT
ncbi:MAG: ABC transporter permease, partial [Aeromicrobium sp.]